MKPFNSKHKQTIAWSILLTILLLALIIIIYLSNIYTKAMNNKDNHYAHTKEHILENRVLTEIDRTESFQEEETYHIFFGQTNQQKDVIVFSAVPYDEEDLVIIDKEDIITEEQVTKQLMKECSSCSKLMVKPAMINKKPLWELTYRDEHNRYNFDYFSMEDGSRYERLQLKQTFN